MSFVDYTSQTTPVGKLPILPSNKINNTLYKSKRQLKISSFTESWSSNRRDGEKGLKNSKTRGVGVGGKSGGKVKKNDKST